MRTAAFYVTAVAVAATCVRAIAACVIADPPATLPTVSDAPTIQHDSLVPPPPVLTAWPEEFVIEVNVPDPTAASAEFQWGMYIDYTSGQSESAVFDGNSTGGVSDGGVRTIAVPLPEPDPTQCHVVSFFLHVHSSTCLGGMQCVVPDQAGNDVATWFYDPVQGCSAYDAGAFADGSFPVVTLDGFSPIMTDGSE